MKKLSIAVASVFAATSLSTIAAPVQMTESEMSGVYAGAKITDAYLDGSNGGLISIISANTNKGKGNGGELFVLVESNFTDDFLAVSLTNIDGTEGLVEKNAYDPIKKTRFFTTTYTATDPGFGGKR